MSTSAVVESTRNVAEAGILDRIIAETRLTPDDEAYDIAKRGVSAFIEELLKPHNQNEPVKKAMVDRMIAEIDAKLKAKGLVGETPSAEDAKRKRLHLSDRGLQAAQIAQEYRASLGAALFGSASTPELEGYLEFIRRLEAYHSDVVRGWEQGRTSPP